MHKESILLRDCPVAEIPAGTPAVLPAGTTVIITQTLGGSVTVRARGTLYRIAPEQVSTLKGFGGAEPAATQAAPASASMFSEQAVWAALKTCFDPEIPLNIVDLGLVYDLAAEPTADGRHVVEVKMTLTAPGCGMGPVIAEDARAKIAALPGVAEAKVHIVWDPAWTPQMMSTEGRQVLGLE
ncbi:MAG TPA: iron-sulfur cluster assembly protein [Opitutaceae bacterium]|nr:iron-sulfur cluster assembly protein [Opitutaceae bacterium]